MIDAAAERLQGLQNLLFITGAGISVDSGLPTYRGVGGIYDGVETEDGLPIEVALSGPMFRKRPAQTWKYLREIGDACRGAVPNAAHRHIAELERTRERVWVLTQNVDGLHVVAGSKQVIPIHGDANQLCCTACSWSLRIRDYSELDEQFATQTVPRCPECDANIRPAVVLFGEMLPIAAVERLETELRRGFDAVISIGTSSSFPYIVAPVLQARARGKLTIEINPAVTELSSLVDIHLQLGAAEAMNALMRRTSDLKY